MEQDLTLSEDQVVNYSKVAVEHFNNHVLMLRHYLLVEDIVDSIKVGAICNVFLISVGAKASRKCTGKRRLQL